MAMTTDLHLESYISETAAVPYRRVGLVPMQANEEAS